MKNSMTTTRTRTDSMEVHTLWDAFTESVLTFPPNDAVGSLGDAYCPVSGIARWMATLPVAQSTALRFVVNPRVITDRATGQIASQFVKVEMILAHVPVRQDGTARVRRNELTFLFALESISFEKRTGAWDRTGRVRPVALHDEGLEFETVREAT